MDLHDGKIYEEKYPFFRLVGEGCRKFLHGQTTADVLTPPTGKKILSCWLSPEGYLQALLEIIYRENLFEIILLVGEESNLIKGFNKVIFPTDKVILEALGTKRRIQKISFNESWKESPVEWLSDNESVPKIFQDYQNCSYEEFIIWKIKQGIPYTLSEINYKNNPYELGLFDLLNFKKGCYLGQEMMAKIFNGNRIKQELRFWESDQILEKGNNLCSDPFEDTKPQRNVGIITSSFAIGGFRSIGLAMIRSLALSKDKLYLSKTNKEVNIYKPIGFSGMLDVI